jgi:hypothetical protein
MCTDAQASVAAFLASPREIPVAGTGARAMSSDAVGPGVAVTCRGLPTTLRPPPLCGSPGRTGVSTPIGAYLDSLREVPADADPVECVCATAMSRWVRVVPEALASIPWHLGWLFRALGVVAATVALASTAWALFVSRTP